MQLKRSMAGALILAFATLGFGQRGEPHPYDLLDVSWSLKYDAAARTIRGAVTNTVQVKSAGDLWFDCGPLQIESVTANGATATFRHEGEKLIVSPRPSKAGEKLQIRILYSGSPSAGIYFVDAARAYPATTGMVYTQGEAEDTRYWLPTYDFPDDKATSEAFVTVPPGEFALSNGKLMGIDKKADGWTYHWKMSKPHSTYLISLVAGPYAEGREYLGKMPVSWFTPPGTERMGATAFGGTNKMIAFFNRLTGFNYPYEKFSQVTVADFMFGGMENTTAVTQTISTLHKPENEPIANSAGLVAHELAHQWFGDTVTCIDWSHIWLNEGFASFLPMFWFREAKGRDYYDLNRFDLFAGAIGSQRATRRPVVSAKFEVPMDIFDGQVYGGGAARLATLMGQLGEKTFWSGVRQYLNRFKFGNARTEDFFSVMSSASGRDLQPFMRQFLYTDGVPQLNVSRRGNQIVIGQTAPYFDLDLKLSFLDRDEIAKELPVKIRGAETVVDARGMDGKLVVLDYPVTAMATINYQIEASAQDLLRIWRLAPNAASKMMVLGRFAGKVSKDDLLEVARDEKSSLVLMRLLPLLDEKAVPYLVELSRGFDRELAYAAIGALGAFDATSSMAHGRLEEAWRKDKNEYIRNSALASLLKNAKNGGYAAEAWTTESEKEMFKQSSLNWLAGHDKTLARERALEAARNAPEPLRVAAIRVLGSLKDEKGSREVYNRLAAIAGEPNYGSRAAAIDALANYGNKAAIPLIEPRLRSSLFFERRAAKSAIGRLNAVR